MTIKKFEDILSWQKAGGLTVDVFREFNDCRNWSFKDQIQRASVSIMNNIAEGFERKSNKDFRHFLYMAKGSCGEVRSMLSLAARLNYISSSTFEKLIKQSIEISKLIAGLIKTLNF